MFMTIPCLTVRRPLRLCFLTRAYARTLLSICKMYDYSLCPAAPPPHFYKTFLLLCSASKPWVVFFPFHNHPT